MFVAGNFLAAIAKVIDILLSTYFWIVLISALLSWVNPDPWNPIVRFLRGMTDPVFRRVRKIIPPFGMLDLSPVLVLLAITFLQMFLVRTLMDMASRMR